MNSPFKALVPVEQPQQQLAVAETASTAMAARAKALVEARYIIAKKFPRDWDIFREKMLKECKRPTFAAVARYEKPIGNDRTKWPRGPSIRFAEAAVRNMTNIGVETITTYDDREKRIVSVLVTDYESSVPYEEDITIVKTIERRRKKDGDEVIGSRKNSYGDDLFIIVATDDEIINKQRALVSKTIRTLALRLVPGDIIDECMGLVLDTLRAEDAQNPDAAKRKLFDAFGEIGIRVENLKEFLGHDAATLQPKELSELRGIYGAIRDGESTWRDAMEAKEAADAGKPPAPPAMPKAKSEKATPTVAEMGAAAQARQPVAQPGGGGSAASVVGAVLGADHPVAQALKQTAAAVGIGPDAKAVDFEVRTAGGVRVTVDTNEAVHNVKDKAREDIKTPFDDMRSDAQFEDGRSEPPLFDAAGKVAVGLPLPEKAQPGTFMATPAEVKGIVVRARAKKVNLLELLGTLPDPIGVRIVGEGEAQTIEGLTKENYKLLKAQLS